MKLKANMTRDEVAKLPEGTVLSIPGLSENVILGPDDFDEMEEYEGRWVTGVNFDANVGGINYIADYYALMCATIVK